MKCRSAERVDQLVATALLSEQLFDDLAIIDQLDRPADAAHVLFGRIDGQRVAE